MPYIDEENRKELLETLGLNHIIQFNVTPGELNFIITTLLLATNPRCYRDYNELIGVLECCKQEFYRRAVVPYEDMKRDENGEVYR